MSPTQARTALRLADGLPATLGRRWTFSERGPCCAIGHMAVALGEPLPDTDGWWPAKGQDLVRLTTGLRLVPLAGANDNARADRRRRAVIREVERQLRANGYDPAALRATADA